MKIQLPVKSNEGTPTVRRLGTRLSTEALNGKAIPAAMCRTMEYMGVPSRICPEVESAADFRYAPGTFVQVEGANGKRDHGYIESYNEGCCFTYVIDLESGKKVYAPESFVGVDAAAVERCRALPLKKRMNVRVIRK